MLKNAEKDQRELNRKLNYDALTGLPVYNKFVDKLEAYMAANGKTGLYFLSSDFSNFQYVNEMYGYEVGDRILHDFAVELQEKCQEGVLFCRVTSDAEGRFRGGCQTGVPDVYEFFCEEDQQPV